MELLSEKKHDTEDKQWWVIEWAKKENLFVNEVCPRLGLNAIMNPAKGTDPYAHDILVDGKIADLKCQQTPFFKAGDLYNILSQYAITFNRKDYLRYRKMYPNIHIFFWIDWQTLEIQIGGKPYKVAPMSGVWKATLPQIKELIEGGNVPLHSYKRRQNDVSGNAKNSYILDLRLLEQLY